MRFRELEYSRTFNLGHYQSEHITLKADLDETEDLTESFKTLKFAVFRLHKEGEQIEETKKIVEADERLEPVRKAFPQDLASLLVFEEKQDSIIVKPKEFLGSDNFAKIASIVRNLGGEYISQGRQSHFRISRKAGK